MEDEYLINKKKREDAQGSAEFQKMHDRDMIWGIVSSIMAYPIFYALKYIYSLLH
jgi:hypothetical protein